MIGDPASAPLTPYILDRPSAYPPAEGRNSHIPYGLWICPDGWQVLHDRNYVPRSARPGDGSQAVAVPILPGGRGRWVNWQASGYFFVGGSYPSLTHRPVKKAERLALAHGEQILDDFHSGCPVWRYVARSDNLPLGLDRWRG